MDDEEVQKQLDHMVKFIYREADEKANEIKAKAQEEFSIEKQRIVQEEKQKIQKYFEQKEKTTEAKIRIMYSNEHNQSRLRMLKSKEEGVQKLLSQAHHRLSEVTKDTAGYKSLMRLLVLQGLLKLQEEKVVVICRKQDTALVQEVLPLAQDDYKKKIGKPCDVVIDDSTHLPAGPESAKEGEMCSGGIVLGTPDGKIICSNTLDARLAMAFEGRLPEIRKILYGESLTRVHKD